MNSPKYICYHKELEKQRPTNIFERSSIKSPTNYTNKNKPSDFYQTHLISIKPSKTSLFIEQNDMIPRKMSYFKGKVLDSEDDYKQYLTETIQNKMNRQIQQTTLIFSYDTFNPKANIHTYVDNIPHIVLLCKITNGYFVAAYSQSPINGDNINQGRGFLVSLTNRKSFDLVQGKKALKYDKQFLIFGNSEVRVSGNSTKIFSNFGINNSHFDSRGQKVSEFLGQGQSKQAVLDHFQVQKLVFK